MDGEPEATLRRRFEAGDLDGTLSFAIETYGAELYGFVAGLARNTGIADDVFGAMCERMWKGLPKFRWESSLRVWAYQIARNEFLRSTRRTNRGKRDLPISQLGSVQQLVARARTMTPIYQQSAVKDRFAKVREQLDPDDHALLGLRLDRQMSWTEIAKVMGDEAAGAREAAALRKRFERLKVKLRELVKTHAE